jgi:hypothetical protein
VFWGFGWGEEIVYDISRMDKEEGSVARFVRTFRREYVFGMIVVAVDGFVLTEGF